MPSADTIVALATAAGQAGVGIVRLSGPAVPTIMNALCGRMLHPRRASFTRFLDDDGSAIDEGIGLYFPAPRSYTGEDVFELQGHGGPVLLRLLIQRCVDLGARLAEPGEFTRRAFMNDKLDLAQAEAVADLIGASTEHAARSAMRSLTGEFSNRVHELQSQLTGIRTFVEATLDFPEEDINPIERSRVLDELHALTRSVDAALAAARQGSLLRDGVRVALVGAPNVGKSSIINMLSKEEVAIVTSIPGTTRDLIRRTVAIDGLPIHIVDTAGLRAPSDPVEEIGIERTWQAIGSADLILLISEAASTSTDAFNQLHNRLAEGQRVLRVRNKIDLTGRAASATLSADGDEVWISAKTGQGMEMLEQAIARAAGWSGASEGVVMARERHVQALTRCGARLEAAVSTLPQWELVAEELRDAQRALSELTGQVTSDDLLGEIFSRFCIGK